MKVHIVSDSEQVIGVFSSLASANEFARGAEVVLAGEYASVESVELGFGYIRNPWSGKEFELDEEAE